jgi:peptidoglycan hydrolase-like protein with peptidoglycan-binding domain
MNKIISPLRQDMQGSAVVDLQDALRACLDRGALLAQDSALRDQMLAALSPERNAQTYGTATSRLVSIFQQERNLRASGEVDGPTAAALNALLTEWGLLDESTDPTTLQFSVRGQLRNPDVSAKESTLLLTNGFHVPGQ